MNWYNKGDKSLTDRQLKYFENWLLEVKAMTQVQRDSMMRITPEQSQDPLLEVKNTIMDEQVLGDRERIELQNKEVLELFRGHPVYVVTRKTKRSSGNIDWHSKAVYCTKTMRLLFGLGQFLAD